jgi:hypothetical protein
MKSILLHGLIGSLISVSGVIVGMEKNQISPYISQGNFYTQYGFGKYAPFNRDGTISDKHIINENTLKSLNKFKGDIIKKEDTYYIKVKIQYRLDEYRDLEYIDLGRYPFFVPIDLTQEQLKELTRIHTQQGQFAGSIFALDDKGNQFYIDDIPRELDFFDFTEKAIKISPLEKSNNVNNNDTFMVKLFATPFTGTIFCVGISTIAIAVWLYAGSHA